MTQETQHFTRTFRRLRGSRKQAAFAAQYRTELAREEAARRAAMRAGIALSNK